MKRVQLITLFVLIVVILGLGIGSAKTYILNKTTTKTPAPAIATQSQPQPITIGAFVVPGMPIRFTEASAVNDRGALIHQRRNHSAPIIAAKLSAKHSGFPRPAITSGSPRLPVIASDVYLPSASAPNP